jgi:hypothetical protein
VDPFAGGLDSAGGPAPGLRDIASDPTWSCLILKVMLEEIPARAGTRRGGAWPR